MKPETEPTAAMMGAGVGRMQRLLSDMVRDRVLDRDEAQVLSDWADLYVHEIYIAMRQAAKPKAASTGYQS